MFKLDYDTIKRLHAEVGFKGPLLDAGGCETPTIADYDISIRKAYHTVVNLGGVNRAITVPHENQQDRYVNIVRPWSFIDPSYLILNPNKGDPYIEELPAKYSEHFNTVILVSVFEHVDNPYKVSDALFAIIKPGGYLFNSTPFIFPYHPSPNDNFRFSPRALKLIHESSGFNVLQNTFHINYQTVAGIGDTNPSNYGAPQAVMASMALCQKPERK
jgi:SAM-dependent methyltransferase